MSLFCPRPGCTALLREDLQFRTEMEAYNLPQRRFLCHAGHSVTLGIPDATLRPSLGAPVKLPNQGRQERACAQCGDSFRGINTRQKFCSPICTRAADAERNRTYPKKGTKMTGEALRQVRAIPRPWNSWKRNGTPPQPYAARSRTLEQRWA